MPYNIIVGRDEADRRLMGEKGLIFLGKHYVRMGQTTSLSNKIFMDVARSHVVLISGKRGSGKSYTLSIMAEEMTNLSKEIADKLSVVILDTMGIFWTMKYPNTRDEELLDEWNLKPKGLDVKIYVPFGFYEKAQEKEIPVDFSFAIKPSELSAEDWCNTFEISLNDPVGILIERILENLEDQFRDNYSIEEIINAIRDDERTPILVKEAAENRFLAAKSWGLFSKEGTKIKDMVKGGQVSILDVSAYTNVSGSWGIKNLVIGLIARKLLRERMFIRRVEEVTAIKSGMSYFEFGDEKQEMPLVWIMIDEAHECLPRTGKTAATDALTQLLREGRQPGISLVLATQQPGEIHQDVITQSDIVISHRITAKRDIDALNNMMQTYLTADIQKYINDLPRLKGSAIILDDNSERIYPVRIKPKMSWHGGETPTAVKLKRKELLDLGL